MIKSLWIALTTAAMFAGADAAQAATAQSYTFALTASVSGTYQNHVEFDSNKCGDPNDPPTDPNRAVFDEDATFGFRYEARPITFALVPKAHDYAKGRTTSAAGRWHQHGTWYAGNNCSGPPQTEGCTGSIGYNGLSHQFTPGSAGSVVYYNAKGVTFVVHAGSDTIGELLSSETNCASVAGRNAKPVFGLRDALDPWQTVYTQIRARTLDRVHVGGVITVTGKQPLYRGIYEPATCNDARDPCSGHLKAHATITLKRLR